MLYTYINISKRCIHDSRIYTNLYSYHPQVSTVYKYGIAFISLVSQYFCPKSITVIDKFYSKRYSPYRAAE